MGARATSLEPGRRARVSRVGVILAVIAALSTACGSQSAARHTSVSRSVNCQGAGFLAVAAIRDRSARRVLRVAARYLRDHGVVAVLDRHSSCAKLEAFAYAPKDHWTVIIWPGYFNGTEIPLAHALARGLDTTVVSSHEYEEEYWTLSMFRGNESIDRFASWPTYFRTRGAEGRRLSREWRGHPDRVARAVGLPIRVIARYLVPRAHGKAFPDDQFPRDNFWVFTDLWRRMGIMYPERGNRYVAVLRVGDNFLDKLPATEL